MIVVHRLIFLMWFAVGIEGKNPMDEEEEDCAGRVMGIQSHVRDQLLKQPDYDPRDIVALLEKYGDAHISDSGWSAVDPEEWYSDR